MPQYALKKYPLFKLNWKSVVLGEVSSRDWFCSHKHRSGSSNSRVDQRRKVSEIRGEKFGEIIQIRERIQREFEDVGRDFENYIQGRNIILRLMKWSNY